MKKTRKLLLVALLMFVFAAATGGAYAYWAGKVNAPAAKTDDVTINIGEGKETNTEWQINDPVFTNDVLVPAGRIAQSKSDEGYAGKNITDNVIADYDVYWKTSSGGGTAAGATASLKVEYSDVKIAGQITTHADLVNVQIHDGTEYVTLNSSNGYTFTPKIVADDTNQFDVKIKVTLTEPATKAAYEAIKGQPITLKIKFSLTVD